MDTLEELANALRQGSWDEFLADAGQRSSTTFDMLWLREPEAAREIFNDIYEHLTKERHD